MLRPVPGQLGYLPQCDWNARDHQYSQKRTGPVICEWRAIIRRTWHWRAHLGRVSQEVTSRFGHAEAAVIHLDGVAYRWTYSELWQRAVEAACSLIAHGVGKGTRVGLLMTNRLEFLSCFFGTALAGGVPTPISTFFTATELDEVLRISGCTVLLLEQNVLKKNFMEILAGLEPHITTASPPHFHLGPLSILAASGLRRRQYRPRRHRGMARFSRTRQRGGSRTR